MQRGLRQQGFTLVETIIVLVVLGVLGAAAGYGLVGGARAFSATAAAVDTLGKLRYASERMVREIREMRRDPAVPATFDIQAMNVTSLAFTRSDGITVTLAAAPPLVTLAYSTPAVTETLSDEVGSMVFRYLQADGATPATGSGDIAFVEFELVLSNNGNTYPQRGRVALRNRQ